MAMDLTTAATESDTETPPTSQPRKTHSHHAPLPTVEVVAYKECLKNHAASIGGHALDGCCEFMLGPMANPSDPTSLKCGACGCHRNFHRRDPDDPAPLATAGARRTNSASQLLLSLSQQSPSGPSDEIDPRVVGYLNGHRQRSKKRFRTKFRQEQKEKMQEFAERIGWRLRRGEERLVEEFCKSIGVGRGIFKVWMHNNKSSNSRREKQDVHLLHHSSSSNGNGNGNGNCAAVVYHQFYANGGAQEAQ